VIENDLEAFLDESGTSRCSQLLTVAACIGAHDQWARFLADWREPGFHAHKTDCLKPHLFKAITECGLEGFAISIRAQDYDRYASHQSRSVLGNAYAVATFSCVDQVCRWSRGQNRKVMFSIESGQPNADWVERVVNNMALDHQWQDQIAGVSLVRKSHCFQLHAADFLANARSAGDEWWERFWKTGKFGRLEISGEIFKSLSDDVRRLAAEGRARRTRLRRDAAREKPLGSHGPDSS
jgi:hypothetical protein